MIDLTKAISITQNSGNKKLNGMGETYNVRLAIHNKADGTNSVAFTFYGKNFYNYFKGHGVAVYLVGDKIVFAIDDKKGYTFSTRSRENAQVPNGIIRIINDKLLLYCISKEGRYKMKYDYDSKLYYINTRENMDK